MSSIVWHPCRSKYTPDDPSNCLNILSCRPHLFLALLMNNLSHQIEWCLAEHSDEYLCWCKRKPTYGAVQLSTCLLMTVDISPDECILYNLAFSFFCDILCLLVNYRICQNWSNFFWGRILDNLFPSIWTFSKQDHWTLDVVSSIILKDGHWSAFGRVSYYYCCHNIRWNCMLSNEYVLDIKERLNWKNGLIALASVASLKMNED